MSNTIRFPLHITLSRSRSLLIKHRSSTVLIPCYQQRLPVALSRSLISRSSFVSTSSSWSISSHHRKPTRSNKMTASSLKPEPKTSSYLSFVNSSPTPFHVTSTAISLLTSAGFERISETTGFSTQSLQPGGKYYYTRNQSSILAFVLPLKENLGKGTGVSVVAGHSDSPRLILRPVSKKEKGGYLMVACEVYGGLSPAGW